MGEGDLAIPTSSIHYIFSHKIGNFDIKPTSRSSRSLWDDPRNKISQNSKKEILNPSAPKTFKKNFNKKKNKIATKKKWSYVYRFLLDI